MNTGERQDVFQEQHTFPLIVNAFERVPDALVIINQWHAKLNRNWFSRLRYLLLGAHHELCAL